MKSEGIYFQIKSEHHNLIMNTAKLTNEEKEVKEKEDKLNKFNQQILNAIIDDDDERFYQLISQHNIDSNSNQRFYMTNYKFPLILSNKPTFVSLCAFFGSEKCFTALTMMFSGGINSSEFNKCDEKGRSPMHFACFSNNLSILRMYDSNRFTFNCTDSRGFTPSHYSAMAGTIDVMKYFWSKGVDVISSVNYDGMTPFHIACMYGNKEIVTFLNEKVTNNTHFKEKINKMNRYGQSYLHLACKSGNNDILNYLFLHMDKTIYHVNLLDSELKSPLNYAVESGNLKCVKTLCEIGKASITSHSQKHVAFIDAAEGGYADIVLYFLKKKRNIEINIRNVYGNTALDVAVINSHLSVIKILIENGATKKYNELQIVNLFKLALSTLNFDVISFLDSAIIIPYEKNGHEFMSQAIKLKNKKLVDFLHKKNCSF